MLTHSDSPESLTIIIPAFCEAANLKDAHESVLRALVKANINDYEIIIVTNLRKDGSHDGTPDIANAITAHSPNTKHIYNPCYVGIGHKFRQGVRAATKEYVAWVPGDNETDEDSLVELLRNTGKAEIIATYVVNKNVRTLQRRFVSKGFVLLCNFLFGLNLKYFNGVSVIERKLIMAVPLSTDSFAFMAEAIIYLVKSGVKYTELPIKIKPITNQSASFTIKSVFECSALLVKLFWRINILRQTITIPIPSI